MGSAGARPRTRQTESHRGLRAARRKPQELSLQAVVYLAGSAPLLLDGSRASLTHDVDALCIEHARRREESVSAARETANEMGIDQEWLNL